MSARKRDPVNTAKHRVYEVRRAASQVLRAADALSKAAQILSRAGFENAARSMRTAAHEAAQAIVTLESQMEREGNAP